MKRTFQQALFVGFLASAVAADAFGVVPKVVAHRGFWDVDGSAQNSISSLRNAHEAGCYASEFDVWMTADSVLVVNHDDNINGINIEGSTASEVLDQRLKNGETVPTLESYLAAAEGLPGMRLVLELKAHNSKSREREAIERILQMVKSHGLEGVTDYITFSRDAFAVLAGKAPETASVQYLEGDYIPAQVAFLGGNGIDYHISVLKNHPEWINQCHELGLTVNVWTVNDAADMQWCIDHGVDLITTNAPELLQSLLK